MPAALAPAAPDLGRLARTLGLSVLAQHVDPGPAGARTGYVVAEALKAAGAKGSIVNHSEHGLPEREVGWAVARLTGLGLSAVVCARDVEEARRLAAFRPPYLAVEPPELIGGSVSVANARPEIVRDTVAAVRSVSPGTAVLCGAGVHDRADVAKALALGSEGILVASAVTRSSDPAGALAELFRGFGAPRRPPGDPPLVT